MNFLPSIILIITLTIIESTLAVPSSFVFPFKRIQPTLSVTSEINNNAVRQTINGTTRHLGFIYSGPTIRKELLINGTADDSFTLTFFTGGNLNTSDLDIEISSNDTEILEPKKDVELSLNTTPFYINATVELYFVRFVGPVMLKFEARRITDNTIADSISIEILVAGLVIFEESTRSVVSGRENVFRVESYLDVYDKRYWELGAQVQYLNGSNLIQSLDPPQNLNTKTDLRDLELSLTNMTGQIQWDTVACHVMGNEQDNTVVSLKSGCGLGFGIVANETERSLKFGLSFEEDRGGSFQIFFQWVEFTIDTIFDDEEMTTFLNVEIGGQPPAIVRRIEPGNPFSKNGGEELYIETINAVDVNITSFNVLDKEFKLISGSRTFINGPDDFYETAKFLTEPGTGHNLAWTLTGFRVNDTDNNNNQKAIFLDRTGFLFSYDDQHIELIDLDPRIVADGGGEEGTLFGNFSNFDREKSDHNIFIGNRKLSKENLISVSTSELHFIFPARLQIGATWNYELYVQIGNSYSNALEFTYSKSSLIVDGRVFGASWQDGVYTVSSCGTSTFVVSVDATNNDTVLYEWMIYDDAGIDVLADFSLITNTESNEIEIPNELFLSHEIVYTVFSSITVGKTTGSISFLVQRSKDVVVGVTLIKPENRTISIPNVNMRVVAKIDIPECAPKGDSLFYEWEYERENQTSNIALRSDNTGARFHNQSSQTQLQKYVFSYANNSGTRYGEITPTRLGRELIIPIKHLTYGTHRIRLTVRGNQDNKFIGFDETTHTVLPAALVSRIRIGEVSRTVSDAEDMEVSGANSFDPDIVIPENRENGLSFEWVCLFSISADMNNANPCDSTLLPDEVKFKAAFNISKEALAAKTALSSRPIDGEVYVQYALNVRKGERESSSTQLITIVQSGGRELAKVQDIRILNSRGDMIDPNRVEFWEDVVIQPVAPSRVQWRYRLDSPVTERSQFFASNSQLISTPGYYTTTGSSSLSYKQLPLGIRADSLKPHDEYQFTISFQEVGKITNEVTIQLKTVEVPSLIFPPLSKTSGTQTTVFRSSLYTTFRSNSSFVYQFYLLEIDGSSREYCVDGCTGANTVRFQISKAGKYNLQGRLYAANGRTLLSVQNNSRIIEVSPSSNDSFTHDDDEIDNDYKLGDDGTVHQRGFFVAQSIYERDSSMVSLSADDANEKCANYAKKWARKSRAIVQNEIPNTPSTRNYVALAANHARLRCAEDEEILYDLLTIVDQAISRTPPEESLSSVTYSDVPGLPDVELQEELRRFYNFSIARAISHAAEGTSHRKPLTDSEKVDNIIIDLAELWTQHMTVATAQNRVCGWDGTYSSDTNDGEPINTIDQSWKSATIGLNSIRVAVRCNPEHGTSLQLPHSSFSWCDDVYAMNQTNRKLITLSESFDYPYLSSVQGNNHSDSERLVMVDITTLGESNQLVSAMPDNYVFRPTLENDRDNETCFQVGLKMNEQSIQGSGECTENIPYTMWPRKPFGKRLRHWFENDTYKKRTEGIKIAVESRNSTNIVITKSNMLGLYGISRTTCGNQLVGQQTLEGFRSSLLGLVIAAFVLALILVMVIYFVIARRTNQDEYEEFADMDAFVERDTFGRRDIVLSMGTEEQSSSTTIRTANSRSNTSEESLRDHSHTPFPDENQSMRRTNR